METIDKVGAIIQDADGRVLLVRAAYAGHTLIAPGGRREPGESDEEALGRELREELGVYVDSMEYFGEWTEPAALHPGRMVHMTLYRVTVDGTPTPSGEIAEMVWADGSTKEPIGSIMRDHAIPVLEAESNG